MSKFRHDIGCAAGLMPVHATRLTIERDDPPGGGSAVADDELEDQHLEGDDIAGHEDADDQPRRTKRQQLAYDELKSDRDRLKADFEKQAREAEELRMRLTALETEHTTRKEVNDQTNAQLDRAKQRAREVVAEIRKIPKDDPQYSEKVYEAMFTRVYEDQIATSQEISERTSRNTFQEARTLEQQQADARAEALRELEEAGLEPDDFRFVRALAKDLRDEDPNWFKRVKPEDQIHELVGMVKERFVKTTRSSRDFQDDKRRHREPMDGVIGEGSRSRRGGRQEEDREQEGPGSILADLARNKEAKRVATNRMLRQGF